MGELKLKVISADGTLYGSSESGPEVCLVYTKEYKEGDRICLETDRPGMTVRIRLEDSMDPCLVYVPGTSLTYPIPPADRRQNYSPKSFAGALHVIRARVASEEERMTVRNLAFNPYDLHGDHGMYPHAAANVETRNEAAFAVRNAIDGLCLNREHGNYPYTSWGINRDPKAELTLEFGRPVRIREVVLLLRADFPHDSYWTQAEVVLRDSRSGQEKAETLSLKKTPEKQHFPMEETADTLILRKLVKAEDASPFPALTQLEVWGTEIS